MITSEPFGMFSFFSISARLISTKRVHARRQHLRTSSVLYGLKAQIAALSQTSIISFALPKQYGGLPISESSRSDLCNEPFLQKITSFETMPYPLSRVLTMYPFFQYKDLSDGVASYSSFLNSSSLMFRLSFRQTDTTVSLLISEPL